MSVQEFLAVQEGSFVLVRNLLDEIQLLNGCGLQQAAQALSGVLQQAGCEAPAWHRYDIGVGPVPLDRGGCMVDGAYVFGTVEAEDLLDELATYADGERLDPRLSVEEILRAHPETEHRLTLWQHLGVQHAYERYGFLREAIYRLLVARKILPDAATRVESSAFMPARSADVPPVCQTEKGRKKRVHISPEVRKVILDRCKRGDRHEDIASDYGVVRDTVSGIARRAKVPAVASPFPLPRQ